ncbi:shikimate 5-dehydrogenase [Acetonema longum DSM 6540]|uniref:Shikimate dehydrogenase (NADP(+)) n=2 Tax=Acetonema TaxID=2373 RepID=F7NNK4_9FIRM|nr:shikimate 5-dehydrogenase [Acetonema longum DSM 6540]
MRFYGLLGETLSHSLSPEIHGYLFRRLNIEAAYVLFPVAADKLAEAVNGLRLLGAGGVNVTIPYKISIVPLLDELSVEARMLGAVNTVLFRDGRAIGYNTDYDGFGLMLQQHGIAAAGKTAVVLGTGGAARTAAYWLRDHGAAAVKLVSRRPAGTEPFETLPYDRLKVLPPTDLLVNATPVGTYPHTEETPLDRDLLSRFANLVDLIYNPPETRLLREARQQGIPAVNGLTMLAAQAVAAEEIWQGRSLAGELLEPLGDFLAGLPERTPNLVLIGMPGSGKSTLGVWPRTG